MARKRSRLFLLIVTIVTVGAALVFAFWPRAIKVDIGTVTRDTMMVTIDEEGRTRVHDAYVISTPVAGRLLRVEVDPGDPVEKNETIVAQMRPSNPAVLDVRSLEQARSAEAVASAALRLARAELNRAKADQALANSNLQRIQTLYEKGTASQTELDNAVHEARATQAAFDTANAAIEIRLAELDNARTQLIRFDDEQPFDTSGNHRAYADAIPIRAPITGQVLRIIQQSEITLPVGAPILEVGNVNSDLEVLVELLSTDAVQVAPGNPVLIEKWGGTGSIKATVARVDPWGFTKYSALGVEEQRVNTIIRFDDASPARLGLGHGFRVEAKIIVWQEDNVLTVPSSSLFRKGQNWAVFRVEDNVATLRQIEIGHNNGVQAQVISGLEAGDRIILYPASELYNGLRVAQRDVR
jgi:HlyD family secretion protein